MSAPYDILPERVGIPDDAPVVIRAWRQRRDGAQYDGQLMHCRFADLPERIERYFRQRRYAIAVLREEAHGEDALEVGRVFKHEDTGRWCWWSDGPECRKETG